MFKKMTQKIIVIGAGLYISLCPVFASEISFDGGDEKEKRHKEFVAQKLERMKKKSKNFQTVRESEEECLRRKKIYDEKRHALLEQFAIDERADLDDLIIGQQFDCAEEQKIETESHDVSHSFGEDFWNMRIRWCPELWWRFDGFSECDK